MSNLLIALVRISIRKGFTEWHDIRRYVSQYRKYNDLTFRDIDNVYRELHKQLKRKANNGR